MNHLPAGARQMTTLSNSSKNPLKAGIAIPPVFDFYFTGHRFSGLGGEVLHRLLQENGCAVQYWNFPLQKKKGRQLPLPQTLDFLKPHIIANEDGRLSFFTRYQRFGPSFSECADQIVSASPDILFISCFAFCYADSALELAAAVRNAAPKISIAIGGAGVSAYPEFFMQNPNIDFAFTGEAEVSVPAFIKAIKSGSADLSDLSFASFSRVPNLYCKNNNKIVAPVITKQTRAEEIAFVLKKTNETGNAVYFTTSLSRGCPKKCRFCSNFLCHGRDFRVIPISTIKNALCAISLTLTETEKPVYINFEDDNLLLAPDYFLNVLAAFKEKFHRVFFLAENGLDYTQLTPELVKTLVGLGVRQFNLSIASTHLPILAAEQRNAAFSGYEKVVRILEEHQIRSITYFICGFKKDTKKTIAANIAYLAKQPTLIGISLFYPVPGIYDFTDKTRFDAGPAILCAGSSAFPWNQSLTTAELVTAFRLSRFVNLYKSGNRTDTENALIQKIIDDRRLYTLIRKNGTPCMVPVDHADNEMVRLFFENVSGYFSM